MFALIEAHRSAFAEFDKLAPCWTTQSNACRPTTAAALDAVISCQPTTLAGVLARAQYVIEADLVQERRT